MLTEQQRRELDWEKTDGLMPVDVYKRQMPNHPNPTIATFFIRYLLIHLCLLYTSRCV